MPGQDFRISGFLRGFTAFEWVVLVLAGAGAFFAPMQMRSLWPWDIGPFNAAFIGAIYLASVPAIGMVAWKGNWSPLRIVLPMQLAFTGFGLLASVLHSGLFMPERWTTWVWWFLYVSLPMNAAFHLWLYRGREPAGEVMLPAALQRVLRVVAVLLALYFVALLVAPQAASRFWPWPIDALHGRLYSGAFLALAVGNWLLLRRSASWDVIAHALALLSLGVLGIVGVLVVDAAVARVVWSAAGTWVWMIAFGGFAALGLWLLMHGRQAVPTVAGVAR